MHCTRESGTHRIRCFSLSSLSFVLWSAAGTKKPLFRSFPRTRTAAAMASHGVLLLLSFLLTLLVSPKSAALTDITDSTEEPAITTTASLLQQELAFNNVTSLPSTLNDIVTDIAPEPLDLKTEAKETEILLTPAPTFTPDLELETAAPKDKSSDDEVSTDTAKPAILLTTSSVTPDFVGSEGSGVSSVTVPSSSITPETETAASTTQTVISSTISHTEGSTNTSLTKVPENENSSSNNNNNFPPAIDLEPAFGRSDDLSPVESPEPVSKKAKAMPVTTVAYVTSSVSTSLHEGSSTELPAESSSGSSSSGTSSATETGETALPVISASSSESGMREGRNESMTPSEGTAGDEAAVENESGESAVREEGEGTTRQQKKIWTGIPDSGPHRLAEVSAGIAGMSSSSVTITSTPPAITAKTTTTTEASSPSAPSLEPVLDLTGRSEPESELGSKDFPSLPSSSDQAGNNLSPSDHLAPDSSAPSSFPSSSPPESSDAGMQGGGEASVNHHGDHSEHQDQTSGSTTESKASDEPTLASHAPTPVTTTTAEAASQPEDQYPDPQPVFSVEKNATKLTPVAVVGAGTKNGTASPPDPRNMTDEAAEAKCNRETSSSSRYNLSGFRFSTFEAFISIFVLVFVICAILVLLFVFTIFRRKGNHTFDFQVRFPF